jgi:septal ring factor EnvC (AmiA/AmiB activator)
MAEKISKEVSIMKRRKRIVFAAIAIAILVTAMSMGCVEEKEELSFNESLANLEATKNEIDMAYDELIENLEATKNEIDTTYDSLIAGLKETEEDLEACGVDIEEIRDSNQADAIRREWVSATEQIKRNFIVAKGELEAIATGCSGQTGRVVEAAKKNIGKNLEKIKKRFAEKENLY